MVRSVPPGEQARWTRSVSSGWCVRLAASWRRTRRARRKIREELGRSLHLEGHWFCVVLEEAARSWRRRLLAAAGEPIYVR